MNSYNAGRPVLISVDYAGIDPTTVTLKYDTLAIAVASQTYNPGNVVRDSAGKYHYVLDTTGLFGLVTYEWVSTGPGADAVVGSFLVVPLPF